jgi:lipoyl(octanoyl) transferase
MKQVVFQDLGTVDYQETWDYQERLFAKIIEKKVQNRLSETNEHSFTGNYLLFCEHPHVFTLGKSGSVDNLLVDAKGLEEKNASYYKINRGGDITYHGPGQIVGYPILNLDYFFTDIHKYLRLLEEAIILTLADYQLVGERYPGFTGVWLEPSSPFKARKICAMGVRCSRWVTMHGFAFNVNTDLSYFGHMVPCGIKEKAVTSIERELGKKVDTAEVKNKLKMHLSNLFEMDLVNELIQI